jgi:hypothetical protein
VSRFVRVPQQKTLDKYGLSRQQWISILRSQGGVCAICKKLPPSGRMVTDHEHCRGFKNLPAEARIRYVRGILCWTCNHYCVGRGVSILTSRATTAYLEAHLNRLNGVSA